MVIQETSVRLPDAHFSLVLVSHQSDTNLCLGPKLDIQPLKCPFWHQNFNCLSQNENLSHEINYSVPVSRGRTKVHLSWFLGRKSDTLGGGGSVQKNGNTCLHLFQDRSVRWLDVRSRFCLWLHLPNIYTGKDMHLCEHFEKTWRHVRRRTLPFEYLQTALFCFRIEQRTLKPVSQQNRRTYRREHAASGCHVFGFTPAHTMSGRDIFGVKTSNRLHAFIFTSKNAACKMLHVACWNACRLVSGMKMPWIQKLRGKKKNEKPHPRVVDALRAYPAGIPQYPEDSHSHTFVSNIFLKCDEHQKLWKRPTTPTPGVLKQVNFMKIIW